MKHYPIPSTNVTNLNSRHLKALKLARESLWDGTDPDNFRQPNRYICNAVIAALESFLADTQLFKEASAFYEEMLKALNYGETYSIWLDRTGLVKLDKQDFTVVQTSRLAWLDKMVADLEEHLK